MSWHQDIHVPARLAGARFYARLAPLTTAVLLVLVFLLFTVACGGGTSVVMRELSFEPDTVTIKAGESVTWKNEDRRSRQVMSGAPPAMTDEFMSPVLEKGEEWSQVFDQPGEFPYHDMRIPGLLGRIIVEERQ